MAQRKSILIRAIEKRKQKKAEEEKKPSANPNSRRQTNQQPTSSKPNPSPSKGGKNTNLPQKGTQNDTSSSDVKTNKKGNLANGLSRYSEDQQKDKGKYWAKKASEATTVAERQKYYEKARKHYDKANDIKDARQTRQAGQKEAEKELQDYKGMSGSEMLLYQNLTRASGGNNDYVRKGIEAVQGGSLVDEKYRVKDNSEENGTKVNESVETYNSTIEERDKIAKKANKALANGDYDTYEKLVDKYYKLDGKAKKQYKDYESAKKTYDENVQAFEDMQTKNAYANMGEKLAKGTELSINSSPVSMGFLQGVSFVPVSMFEATQQQTGINLDRRGIDSKAYQNAELAGAITGALAGGKALGTVTGKGWSMVGNAIMDAPSNAVMAQEEAGRQLAESKKITEGLDTGGNGLDSKFYNAENEAWAEPDANGGEKTSTESQEKWNENLYNYVMERYADENGNLPDNIQFKQDKNGMLHYSASGHIDDVIAYYDNAENPTYTLNGVRYSGSAAALKKFGMYEGMSAAGGLLGGGKSAKKAKDAVEEVAENATKKEADDVVEEVAKKSEPEKLVKVEDKTKPPVKTQSQATQKTTVKSKPKKEVPKKEQEEDFFLRTSKEDKAHEAAVKKADRASELADNGKKATSDESASMKDFHNQNVEINKKYADTHEAKVKEVEEYISNYEKRGVDHVRAYNQDSAINGGTPTQGGSYRVSQNEPWYREFYNKHGRPPRKNEIHDLAEQIVKDAENGTTGQIDVDFKDLVKARTDADDYATALNDYHKQYYPDYSDAEFELLKRTGLEKSEWTPEMKKALRSDSSTKTKVKAKKKVTPELQGTPTKAQEEVLNKYFNKGERVSEEISDAIGSIRQETKDEMEKAVKKTGKVPQELKDKAIKEWTERWGDRTSEEFIQKGTNEYVDFLEEYHSKAVKAKPKNSNLPKTSVGADKNKNVPTRKGKATTKTVQTSTGSTVPEEAVGATRNTTPPKYKEQQNRINKILKEKGEESREYQVESHKLRNEMADVRLATDFEGEVNDLSTKVDFTTEDIATAQKAYDMLVAKGREAEGIRMFRHMADYATEAAQKLESYKHIVDNSTAGKVRRAIQAEGKARRELKDANPAKIKNANSEIEKHVKIINEAAKKSKTPQEFAENISKSIDKILEGRKIKAKVPLRDKIVEMAKNVENLDQKNVANLIDSVTEEINSRLGIPTLTSEQMSKIVEYMEKAENATGQAQKDWWARADEIIHSVEESSARDKFRGVQRILLLSNPKTLITRNAGGNILLGVAENVKDIPATAVDAALSKMLGTERTTALSAGKVKAQLKGFGKGTKDWAHDVKTGLDTSPSQTHFEYGQVKTFDPSKGNNVLSKTMLGIANKLDTGIKRTLQLGDRPFYEAAYASRKAELEALAKDGKAFKGLSKEETAEQIEELSKLAALDRVYQSDTALSKWASDFRKKLGVAGDILMPFTQTPANVLDKLLDYSPVGFGKAMAQLGGVKKGVFDQKLFVDRIGRSFTGGGAIMLGYAMAKHGNITTDIYSQSDNTQEYKLRTALGQQSYSIKLGDKWVSINWASPVGNLLTMGADIFNGGVEKETMLQAIYGGTLTAVDGVFSESFLSGVTDLITANAYNSDSEGSGFATKIMSTLYDQGTGQLSPNFTTSLAKVIDPVKRETYDPNKRKQTANQIKSKIPFASKKLAPKVDINGEVMLQYQGRGVGSRIAESFILPHNKSVEVENAVNKEVLSLFDATEETGVLLKSVSNGKLKYKGETYQIEDAKTLSEVQTAVGQYSTDEIGKLIKSDKYQKWKADKNYDKMTKAISDINKAAMDKAVEKYLVDTGKMTQEQYDYTTLTDSQKKLVDKNGASATTLRKASKTLKKAGHSGQGTTSMIDLLDAGYSEKKLKEMGFADTGAKNSYWKKAVEAHNNGISSKTLDKIKKNADSDGNKNLKIDEVKAYINGNEKYKGYTYAQKVAILYALTGSKNW